jgi:hypothetical protein
MLVKYIAIAVYTECTKVRKQRLSNYRQETLVRRALALSSNTLFAFCRVFL